MLEEYRQTQPVAYKIIKKIIALDKPSHAYLIETNGFDKGFDLALCFAKMLLCPSKNQQDCNICHQCQAIDDNNYHELKIIKPDGNWIKKEQLIDLQEEFNKKAVIGKRKVYILLQAEKLNVNSSNSILKFLEEPQEGVIAILLTNNRYQLLDTIISRCQLIALNGQASIVHENTTLSKISQILSESCEEYQSFIEDEKSDESIKSVIKFINFYETNGKKMLLYMNTYWFSLFNDKNIVEKALIMLLHFYKDVINTKVGREIEIFIDYPKDVENVADRNSVKQLVDKINIINKCRQDLIYNANINLLMDRMIIEMEGV